MPVVDLNCDLGEGYDDAALFPFVTSANIACGGHVGNAATMRSACLAALEHGVSIGAHPSYADRGGFGRRDRDVSPARLRAEVTAQVDALRRAATAVGGTVRYLKAHGALYNRIARDPEQAIAVAEAAADAGLPLLGPPGSVIEGEAARQGVPFFREAFADRGYLGDGRLAPRDAAGAVLTDPEVVADRALRIATLGTVTTIDAAELPLRVDSVCLHGDTPGAAGIARAVRGRLEAAHVVVRAFR